MLFFVLFKFCSSWSLREKDQNKVTTKATAKIMGPLDCRSMHEANTKADMTLSGFVPIAIALALVRLTLPNKLGKNSK